MKPADPTASIRQSMNHDVASGRKIFERGAIDIVLLRIRNVERQVVIAVRFVEIDLVNSFRRSLIAFVFFRPDRNATQGNPISFQDASVLKQHQSSRRFFDDDSIRDGIAGQGTEVHVGRRRETADCETDDKKKNQQNFQPYNSGLRARGSRSFVVAVLGNVTNGPPSRGAVSENATSGILLGSPSSGNSLRSGK